MFARQKTTHHIYQLLYLPTISIILGVFSSYHAYNGNYSYTALGAFVSILILFFIRREIRKIMLCLSFLGIGSSAIQLQYYSTLQSQQKISSLDNNFVACVTKKSSSSSSQEGEVLDLLILEKKRFLKQPTWAKTDASVRVYAKSKSNFQIDDIIYLKNLPITTLGQDLPLEKTPSFFDYLCKEGICATIFTSHLSGTLLYRPSVSIARTVGNKRTSMASSLDSLHGPAKQMYATVFLGRKESLLKQELWQYWGVLHLLARSGTHLMVFLMLWVFLFKVVPLPFALKQAIYTAMVICYSIFSWPSTSFYRAAFIIILTLLGKILNKQTTLMHILCIAILFALCTNPLQLFFLDFQLSYGLTFTLIWWTQKMNFLEKKGNLYEC